MLLLPLLLTMALPPTNNPLEAYQLPWADELPWTTVIDVTQSPGKTI